MSNSACSIIYTETKLVAGELDLVQGEAFAVKEALSWGDREGKTKVIIESDCLVMVQAIRSTASMKSKFDRIIETCRIYLRRLNNIELYFIKANMVVHTLVRLS